MPSDRGSRSEPEPGSHEPSGDPSTGRLEEGPGELPTASRLGNAGAYAGLGVQFVVSILVFLYAGQWVDKKLDTKPLFLIIGVFVGATAGFYSMYRKIITDQQHDDASRRQKHGG